MEGAIVANQLDMARLLLAAGAQANARREPGGETALDLALREKHPDFAVLLLQHGGKTGAELDAATPQPAPEPAKPAPGR